MPQTFRFDIQSLYQQAFGTLRGKPYDAGQLNDTSPTKVEGYDISQRNTPGITNAVALNDEEGTEFVSVRNVLRAKMLTGQEIFMPIELGGVLLPNEPTLAVQMVTRIVKTSLTGSARKGTVKELIGRDDDVLTIRGICFNEQSTKVYPEDQVNAIRALVDRKESLTIVCALTNLFGIYRVVIESANFPEMVGVQNAQAYELQCVSDEEFDLEVDEGPLF
jgi:phage protein U